MDDKNLYLVTFNNEYWAHNKTYTMKLTKGEKDLIQWLDIQGYFDRTIVSISPIADENIEF